MRILIIFFITSFITTSYYHFMFRFEKEEKSRDCASSGECVFHPGWGEGPWGALTTDGGRATEDWKMELIRVKMRKVSQLLQKKLK